MATISIKKAIHELAKNPWTAVIVNRDLEIVQLVSAEDPVPPQLVFELNLRFPGSAFRILRKGDYGEPDIESLLKDVRHGFQLLDAGLLPPGTTCL